MPKHYTLDDIKKIFRDRGCELLEDEYKGCRSTVRYRAKCGHEDSIILYHFTTGKRGNYCKECNRKKKARTFEEVRDEFIRRGCTPLFNEYRNGRDKVEYIAKCGHKCKTEVGQFFLGKGDICRKCLNDTFRFSLDTVKKAFEKEGCIPLFTEYINQHQPLEYIARCGHKNTMDWEHFNKGNGRLCHDCAKQVRKLTIDEVREKFKSEGCQLLSVEYNGFLSKLTYVARCGHITTSIYNDFTSGNNRLCKDCILKNARRLSVASVYDILKKYYPDVIREYKIQTARKFPQWLDFFIPSKNLAIEYNGEQHYKPIRMWGGVEGFEKNKQRDAAKRQYCAENNIRLIEIDGRKYKYHNITDDVILNIINENLHHEDHG